MPDNSYSAIRSYCQFDKMNTAQLKEILRRDSQLPENEDSDMDAILYIMDVIAKRGEDCAEFTNAEKAWDIFNESYSIQESDGKSLYEFDSDELNQTASLDRDRQPNTRHFRGLLRVAVIAAILAATLLIGTVSAYAMGYDLWGAVADWTKDIFSFTTVSEEKFYGEAGIVDALNTIDLIEYGVTERVLPTWLPDGYKYSGSDLFEKSARTVIRYFYTRDNSEICVSIVVLSSPTMRHIEKNDSDVIIYTAGNTEHYIMNNLEETNIAWVTGNCECSIIGDFSIEEAKQIIDSIY
ncbi:MAG: DUF4367 domain-containing protein [Oscillospiraceae bacterium]|jgi:hypothetical protein|nr:DUF4367 domain-containing protein [Oscillospiraceae bacterium]